MKDVIGLLKACVESSSDRSIDLLAQIEQLKSILPYLNIIWTNNPVCVAFSPKGGIVFVSTHTYTDPEKLSRSFGASLYPSIGSAKECRDLCSLGLRIKRWWWWADGRTRGVDWSRAPSLGPCLSACKCTSWIQPQPRHQWLARGPVRALSSSNLNFPGNFVQK